MGFGERLRRARLAKDLTQADLAKAIDYVCQQSNISKLERTDAQGSEWTVHFAQALGVDPVWLATGKGSSDRVKAPEELLEKLEQELIGCFRGLTKEQKENALRGLKALAAQNAALISELADQVRKKP